MTRILLTLLVLLNIATTTAQDSSSSPQQALENYLEMPRELAYLHLNKAVYLKGEQIGFTAYVVNKQNLTPSKTSTNLYVQIKDGDNKIVKEKLVLLENGRASHTITIDSIFSSGNYTIQAFTNWMRNFKEQNHFIDQFKVVEINDSDQTDKVANTAAVDVQFLPESGHLLNSVLNTVGVIAKGKNGMGLSQAQITITDQNNKMIANLRLNEVGIGKFTFVPELGIRYKAKVVEVNGKTTEMPIDLSIEPKGIILSAITSKDDLRLQVKTNAESLPQINSEEYSLMLHNLKSTSLYPVNFENKLNQDFIFNLKSLEYGINTLTLFNANNKVIAERIFFNYQNLPLASLGKPTIMATRDSLEIVMSTQKALDSTRLSVSVLPKNVLPYKQNHSIASYYLLQPYVKGGVEQAAWYFTNIDERKIQELDNLLITQGWSSYDWHAIFNNDINISYKPENLLEFQVVINNFKPRKENQKFLIHATKSRAPQVITIPGDQDSFIVENFMQYENEPLSISRLENEVLSSPPLYIRSMPIKIPGYIANTGYLNVPFKEKILTDVSGNNTRIAFSDDADREQLDEVLIETTYDKVKKRERELANHSWGRISVVDEKDILLFGTLGKYLATKPGVQVFDNLGQFNVGFRLINDGSQYSASDDENPNGVTQIPDENQSSLAAAMDGVIFYLDDMIMDSSFFAEYPLANVDYVEINNTGMGSGFLGSGGSIKVYSRFTSSFGPYETKEYPTYNFPVAFAQKKAYYIPKFSSYTDEVYKNYGVIDWMPEMQVNENGNLSFKIKKPSVDYKVVINGLSQDGTLVHLVQEFASNSSLYE